MDSMDTKQNRQQQLDNKCPPLEYFIQVPEITEEEHRDLRIEGVKYGLDRIKKRVMAEVKKGMQEGTINRDEALAKTIEMLQQIQSADPGAVEVASNLCNDRNEYLEQAGKYTKALKDTIPFIRIIISGGMNASLEEWRMPPVKSSGSKVYFCAFPQCQKIRLFLSEAGFARHWPFHLDPSVQRSKTIQCPYHPCGVEVASVAQLQHHFFDVHRKDMTRAETEEFYRVPLPADEAWLIH